MSTIAERVAAGAALLDRRKPGWDQSIDLTRLLLDSPCRCVLGQLWFNVPSPHFSYSNARESLGLGPIEAKDLGFDAYYDSADEDDEGAEYDALTAEWKRVIAERRAGAQ